MGITKVKELTQKELKTLIDNVLNLLHQNLKSEVLPDLSVWEKYFSKNYQLTSNGVLKCRNINEYLRRYEHLQDTYANIQFSGPIIEPLISGSQFTLHQSIDLTTHEGK